jgi:hypothetical protein
VHHAPWLPQISWHYLNVTGNDAMGLPLLAD